jgi:hypothetical protein
MVAPGHVHPALVSYFPEEEMELGKMWKRSGRNEELPEEDKHRGV